MKKSASFKTAVIAAALAFAIHTSPVQAGSCKAGTVIDLSTAPAAVQTAITTAAGTGKVLQVEQETINEQTVYEARIQDAAGKITIIEVDADGKILTLMTSSHKLGKGVSIDLTSAPAAVQTAITTAAGTGKVLRVEQETIKGVTVYEAEIQDATGKITRIAVDAAGKVITTVTENHGLGDGTVIELSAAPAAVQTALTAAAGTGKILQVEQETENGQTVYEAEIQDTAGKISIVKVDASGAAVAILTGSHGACNGTLIALTAAPAAVQAAITTAAGTGTVLTVEQETAGGLTVYEARIKDAAGKITVVKVDANGALITTTPDAGKTGGGLKSGSKRGR